MMIVYSLFTTTPMQLYTSAALNFYLSKCQVFGGQSIEMLSHNSFCNNRSLILKGTYCIYLIIIIYEHL